MIVRTKKYQLKTGTYVKVALVTLLRRQWWLIIAPIAIASATFFFPNTIWFYISALLVAVLYILFWLIQFFGVTQVEQNKILFERIGYEIDPRYVLMKFSSKQGMPLKWDQFKKAYKNKKSFVLVVSKAQIVHLPFKIFNNTNDVRLVETILKRKNLLK